MRIINDKCAKESEDESNAEREPSEGRGKQQEGANKESEEGGDSMSCVASLINRANNNQTHEENTMYVKRSEGRDSRGAKLDMKVSGEGRVQKDSEKNKQTRK